METSIDMEIYKINILDKSEVLAVSLCQKDEYRELDVERILSAKELTTYKGYQHRKKKVDFLLGRSMAKCAIDKLSACENFAEIEITNSVFGAPIVIGDNMANLGVSISHSNEYATAVSYHRNFPCAIDTEVIRPKCEKAMRSLLECNEASIIKGYNELNILTVMWTAKEAASKVLNIGFTVDTKIFEVDKIQKSSDCLIGSYRYLKGFQFVSQKIGNSILTVASPIVNNKHMFVEQFKLMSIK